jgi:hypothetical protein
MEVVHEKAFFFCSLQRYYPNITIACMFPCLYVWYVSSNIEAFRPPFLRVRKGAEGALINIHTNEGA